MTDANNDRTIRLLEGIKVVEFAQNLAIPMCGRILAGMGADVVKVEPPTGDAMRSARDFGPTEAKAFSLINPDKRSIAVDLGSPQATQVIEVTSHGLLSTLAHSGCSGFLSLWRRVQLWQ